MAQPKHVTASNRDAAVDPAPRAGQQEAGGGNRLFVARQPILTPESNVVGYELLYRSAADPHLVQRNPRAATGHVLATTFFAIGLDKLVGPSRAWINFPREWLIDGVVGAIPPERVVIEILQSVEVDDDLIETCHELKQAGFAIALDRLAIDDPRHTLLDFVDYAKVNLAGVEEEAWPDLVSTIKGARVEPVALKVEDWLDLERASGAGFELFQGYYLTKPNLVSGKEVPVLDTTRLLALQVAADAESTLEDVERVVESDAGLAFRLLRYLNAAAFGFRDPVTTIHSAVVRLGERGARTWLLLATIHAMGKGRPLELITISAIRAHLADRIAEVAGHDSAREEAFMGGLFLNLDAITGMRMESVVASVTLPESVTAALLGEPAGLVGDIVELATAYETGGWTDVNRLTEAVGIAPSRVASEYVRAIDWARESLRY